MSGRAAGKGRIDAKSTNPKDRASSKRVDLSLFPQTALIYGALQFMEGDCKYGGYNWRVGGVDASVYIKAALGHIAAWYNGEVKTPEGGTHLGGALASIAILIDAEVAGCLIDNRPPRVEVGELLRRLQPTVENLYRQFPGGPARFTEKNKKGRKQRFN